MTPNTSLETYSSLPKYNYPDFLSFKSLKAKRFLHTYLGPLAVLYLEEKTFSKQWQIQSLEKWPDSVIHTGINCLIEMIPMRSCRNLTMNEPKTITNRWTMNISLGRGNPIPCVLFYGMIVPDGIIKVFMNRELTK